jgi:hypothetical protein
MEERLTSASCVYSAAMRLKRVLTPRSSKIRAYAPQTSDTLDTESTISYYRDLMTRSLYLPLSYLMKICFKDAADDKEVMGSFERILDEPTASNDDVSIVSDDENEHLGEQFSSASVNIPCGVAENCSDDGNHEESTPGVEDPEVAPRRYPTRNRAPLKL